MLAAGRWRLLFALCTAAGLAAPRAWAGGPAEAPPPILVSRQLLESQRLAVGDVVSLSSDPTGEHPRPFRVAGAYEPTPDPARLGSQWLEARLHLPDLIALTADPSDPDSVESVETINVRLVDPAGAPAFAREVAARWPGVVARPTVAGSDDADPFVILERFHLAIALVTVIASSMFLLALMVMLIDERRETVAVLRLIGLRRRRILVQVFVEGVLIAVAGALVGVVLAVAFEGGFNRFFQWHYDTALVFVHVTPQVAWRSVLLAVPLGVLATLVSSWGLLRQGLLSARR